MAQTMKQSNWIRNIFFISHEDILKVKWISTNNNMYALFDGNISVDSMFLSFFDHLNI